MFLKDWTKDPHAHVSALLFGKPVTPETRLRAKTLNFGVLYGSNNAAMSLTEALRWKTPKIKGGTND